MEVVLLSNAGIPEEAIVSIRVGSVRRQIPLSSGRSFRFAERSTQDWVPEGSLAGNFRVGSRPIFGQTWPQDPSRTTGLVLQCRLHKKSARQTDSKAVPWWQKTIARLPSSTQRMTCTCKSMFYGRSAAPWSF